jgi:hypothetical protein
MMSKILKFQIKMGRLCILFYNFFQIIKKEEKLKNSLDK